MEQSVFRNISLKDALHSFQIRNDSVFQGKGGNTIAVTR